MEPHFVLLADVRAGGDGVESTQYCGAGSSVHEEWNVSLGFVFSDKSLQL